MQAPFLATVHKPFSLHGVPTLRVLCMHGAIAVNRKLVIDWV
eukprot:COSAG01_NODE_65999_length_271_cov_1.191860_2_plen_41_part_01